MTTFQAHPRVPQSRGWVFESRQLAGSRWVHYPSMIQVVSSLDTVDENGLQWHISVSSNGTFPSPEQARFAQQEFDMLDGEEENPRSAKCRHFWLHVDPSKRASR